MSIHLQVSNALKSLSSQLAQSLKNNPSVFEPIYIVTQTEGMNNWLRLQLAEKLGIAANIHFIKPNDAIHKIYQALGGKYQESISSHDLTWLLYIALDEPTFKEKYRYISTYYTQSGAQQHRKRLALAEKMADLYDQYQIYRTDLIKAWNEDKGSDHWQKTLWRRAKEIGGEQFPDKTMVSDYIIEALQDPEKAHNLKKKLPILYFFGLSLITEYHIRLISRIAEYTDIVFMMQNPAPEDYWFEDMSEKFMDYMKRKGRIAQDEKSVANPLLVGWGKLVQDTFSLLFQDDKNLNFYEETGLIPPLTDSLLHKIQHSIYHNQKDNIVFSQADIHDNTLTINACFNPVREVEVLYNYLVHLVEENPKTISARDIVVMVSDIDVYASYIRAVFDNAPYPFKYSIADESYAESDSISNTLIQLLNISEQDFTSEKVVSLLDYSAIRSRFGITDTAAIRTWTQAANIRFGFKGEKINDTRYVSWEYGMQRLMYGLCMSGNEAYSLGDESFYPMDLVEGGESFEVVRYVHFVQTLQQFIQRRKGKKNLTWWVQYINDVMTTFIGDVEDNQDEDYRHLQQQLGRYNLVAGIFKDEISYEVFSHHFMPILNNTRRSHTYASRGITFCSLIPMRSIPFKVVALLGMNYDKFPRKDKRVSFDIMLTHPQKGDRNIRENDKHLMLETLMSAEDRLYISYIGQNIKDNSTLPPSALVDELIDFISGHSDNPDDIRKNFTQKHPLHSFSRKYNAQNPRLYAYIPKSKKSILWTMNQEIHEIPTKTEIQIDRFIAFFKDAIRAYYNQTLNIYFEEIDYSLSETECFELDTLEKWKIKNQLIQTEPINIPDLQQYLVKTSNFPLKNKGILELEDSLENIAFSKDAFIKLTDGLSKSNISILLPIEDMNLSGSIGNIYGNQHISYSFSKNDNSNKFSAYVAYLLLTASGIDIQSVFISNTNGTIQYGKKLDKSKAIAHLKALIGYYQLGHTTLIPFSFKIHNSENSKDNNLADFKKRIKSILENPNFTDSKLYLTHAYNHGYFDTEHTFDLFTEIDTLIRDLISDFFISE
ncbi:MAG: exodeoxyribonuclease V subunit gamma [Chitinophagales bacterium]|nr:exodeoxyribonuclease V subunit gamma [Chitinophagales bacterium]